MSLLHQPVRMHIASVGVSKFCFLLTLAFCGLLLLLIPALQPPARQVDLPQPRPQVRTAQASPPQRARIPSISVEEADSTAWLNSSSAVRGGSIQTKDGRNDNQSPKRATVSKEGVLLRGNGGTLPGSRALDLLVLKDIFIAVKTTRKYHKSRLELLIQTWISQAKEQVSSRL